MKRNLISLLTGCLTVVALFLSSCGEDRSGEYYELIQEDQWIYETMLDRYLWYEDIPKKTTSDFFADPEEFFKSLLSTKCRDGKGDTFSTFVEGEEEALGTEGSLTINESSTYGFDFALYNDPTGTTSHVMARVILVLPDSPASEAGLQRGDWILNVGGYTLTSNNYGYLIQGGATTLTTASLKISGVYNETSQSYEYTYDWANKVELSLSASRAIDIDPFLETEVLTSTSGKKVGYLFYNSFKLGDDEVYLDKINTIFAKFKAKGVTDFILDLRYNPGGYLLCAQRMASCLAPVDKLGKEFVTTVWNDKNQDLNTTYPLEKDCADCNLNLSRLFVITSNNTASASESVINGLKPYMEVNLVGNTTYGKNVASVVIKSPYGFSLQPIVSTVYNSNNESDYANGFAADYVYDDLKYLNQLGELGDPKTDMALAHTLLWIETGSPEASVASSAAKGTRGLTDASLDAPLFRAPKLLDTTVAHRAMQGNLIKE
jgi:C-terminal processing protease CtpA/Prc